MIVNYQHYKLRSLHYSIVKFLNKYDWINDEWWLTDWFTWMFINESFQFSVFNSINHDWLVLDCFKKKKYIYIYHRMISIVTVMMADQQIYYPLWQSNGMMFHECVEIKKKLIEIYMVKTYWNSLILIYVLFFI